MSKELSPTELEKQIKEAERTVRKAKESLRRLLAKKRKQKRARDAETTE